MSPIPVSHVCHPCILFRTDLTCTGISRLNPKASARVSRYELSHNFGRQTLGSCHLVREGVKNIFKESVDKVEFSTRHLVSWRLLELARLFFVPVSVCVWASLAPLSENCFLSNKIPKGSYNQTIFSNAVHVNFNTLIERQ